MISFKSKDSTLCSSSFYELPIRKSYLYLPFLICFSYNFLFRTHIIYFNFLISLFFRETVMCWSAFMHFYRRSFFCILFTFSIFLFISYLINYLENFIIYYFFLLILINFFTLIFNSLFLLI